MSTFTIVHVLISLLTIAAGCAVVAGLLTGGGRPGLVTAFAVGTAATDVTGFGFPFTGLLPSHVVAIVSLLVLGLALFARYGTSFATAWRRIYAVGLVVSLYFNVFVLIVQLFQRIPVLKSLAPTQSEAPFLLTQIAALVATVALSFAAAQRIAGAAPTVRRGSPTRA